MAKVKKFFYKECVEDCLDSGGTIKKYKFSTLRAGVAAIIPLFLTAMLSWTVWVTKCGMAAEAANKKAATNAALITKKADTLNKRIDAEAKQRQKQIEGLMKAQNKQNERMYELMLQIQRDIHNATRASRGTSN